MKTLNMLSWMGAFVCFMLHLTACSAAKASIEFDDTPWKTLSNGCDTTEDPEKYTCEREALEQAYDEGVSLARRLKHCEIDKNKALDIGAIQKKELESDVQFWRAIGIGGTLGGILAGILVGGLAL